MISKTGLALAPLILFCIGVASPAAYANGTISACPTVIPSTATGTYTLTKNLTAKGNCITIKANAVAIDLRGYTITGPGIGTGDGITDGGSCTPKCQQNIIIGSTSSSPGAIQGFQYGIYLTSTKYVTLSHLNVTENVGAGIWLVQNYPVVTGSQTNKNGHYGMYFGGSGNTVNNSAANSNGDYGMYFKGSGNTVNNSGASINAYGMWFVGGGNSVSTSGAGSNEYMGMTFTDGGNIVNNSSAGDNDATGNGYYGMYFVSGGNTITDSVAVFNAKVDGIFINGSSNSLTGTSANNNGGIGISVVCPSNLYGNTATTNTGGNIVTSGAGCARLGNNPAP
jgi:Right handed beta helix region